MKSVAIYCLTVAALIAAGILFHWRSVMMLGIGVGFPLFTAVAFGRLCTFANSITHIVLLKAGLWRAYLKYREGIRVCDLLHTWYEK